MSVVLTLGRKPSELPRGELVGIVRGYYQSHPGYYRPTYVAQATGLSTHQVAMTSRYLWINDQIERHTIERSNGKSINIYGLYSPRKEEHAQSDPK